MARELETACSITPMTLLVKEMMTQEMASLGLNGVINPNEIAIEALMNTEGRSMSCSLAFGTAVHWVSGSRPAYSFVARTPVGWTTGRRTFSAS